MSLLLHVLDPAELDFPFEEPTLFHGLEQLPDALVEPRALRAAYLGRVQPLSVAFAAGVPHAPDRLRARPHRSAARLAPFQFSRLAEMNSMLPLPPLFAFGFANPAMLGWLAAAAAPILIHLWSRRKRREMAWAAMAYLLAAVERRQRRLRIEQWLLVALRTALIVRGRLRGGRAAVGPRRRGDAVGRTDAPRAGDRRLLFDGLSADRQEPFCHAPRSWPRGSSRRARGATPFRWF